MFTSVMDVVRAQFIRFDLAAQAVFRYVRRPREKRWVLPPRPGDDNDDKHEKCPRRAGDLAIATKGRCAGVFSRGAAYLIDVGIIMGFFLLWMLVLTQIMQLITSNNSKNLERFGVIGLVSLFVMFYCYEGILTATAGRTFGKMILGLLIVSYDGKPLPGSVALLRSFIKTVPFAVFTTFFGLLRRDRRGLIDLVCCSAVIYAWDAEGFRAREEHMHEGERLADIDTDEDDESYELRRESGMYDEIP